MTRIDPAHWSASFAWFVLAACALAVLVSLWLIDSPWLFRVVFYGGYTVGVIVLLRGSGIRFREVALLVIPALAAFIFFRYFTAGSVQVFGQTAAFAAPLLVGVGVGRRFALGTLAPGWYSGYTAGNERSANSFREATNEVIRAISSKDNGTFTAHMTKAVVLGNIETSDLDWIDIRRRFLAAALYLGGWEGPVDKEEAGRRREAFYDAFEALVIRRRTWFGRWGRPTTPANGRDLVRGV
jgi:hypothetical protein